MLSSSETDPFTTTEAHSPPRSQTLIHGFPKQRLSFRNVDRVRQRIGSRGAGESERRKLSIGDNVMKNRKRKLSDVDANADASTSASTAVSVTHTGAATSGNRSIRITESNKSHQGQTLGRKAGQAGVATLAYTLKTAELAQRASVGGSALSSLTGLDTSGATAHARAEDAKLRRRRTLAGYSTKQHKSELPHIDLISKLGRSSSASPVATHLRRHSAPSQDQDGTSMSRSLVLHKSSLSREKESRDPGHHSRRLPASYSTAAPGSSTSRIQTRPNRQQGLLNNNSGISINQLSARSLELLIENGLALVFKKMEMNHGFANDTVKRAWIRCNGDIEATDHLLLTMRKAAEKAEASFLQTGPQHSVDEYDESTSEEEEEEEEERRPIKRPRMWNESRALTAAAALPPSSDSIESHYAPRFSSDREGLHPLTDMDDDYTPPVGTKAEAYRRLSEQGRSKEAQKVLVAKVISQGRIITTPRKDILKGKEIVASRSSGVSLDGTGTGTGSSRKKLQTDEGLRINSSSKKSTSQRTERISSDLGLQTTTGRGQRPSPSSGRIGEMTVPGDKTGTGKDRVETTVIVSPLETTPTISKPIKTSSESRSSSVPQHEERPKVTNTTITSYAHRDYQSSATEARTGNPREGEGEREKEKGSKNHDLEQQWSLSDEEVLRKATDLSQVEKLSTKYGEREVLKRFLKLIQAS